MKNILKRLKNKTIIIIAHRLETIKEVNKIFLLKNGKILEQGTFNELLQENTYFKELYKSVK